MPSSTADKSANSAGERTAPTEGKGEQAHAPKDVVRTQGNFSARVTSPASLPVAGGVAEGRVDDVLESLHRSLKDQETVQRLLAAVKKTSAVSRPEATAILSGAKATRRPVRRKVQRQRPPLRESRAISSARCLVGAAESLGLDMSAARSLISSSEGNLERRRAKAAVTDAAKALSEAKRAAESQLLTLLPELQGKIEDLGANGCRSASAEKGMSIAKAALKKGNYRTAIAALATSRRALSEAQTSFIRRILLESRSKFVSAKRAGVNIDTAVRALMTAKESLRLGDLGSAVRMAKRAESAVDVTMRAHRNAARSLSALARAVAVADQIGANSLEEKSLLQQSKGLFESGAYFKSDELSMKALEGVDSNLQRKTLESVERAEKALFLAKESGAPCAPLQSRMAEAKGRLAAKEHAKCLAMANSVLVDATAEALSSLKEKIGGIGQFARSVSGEIESLAQVQEAIVHSRERNLEMVRKYATMSEEVVSQAYDNAAAYMRVSQDIVKQAYDSSIGLEQENRMAGVEPRSMEPPKSPAAQILGITSGERKLRIIDLYLSGRIDDKQLDKLLALVDTTSAEIEISDEIREAQFAKR